MYDRNVISNLSVIQAKGVVRKWVADFQKEHGKAPERADMQAVKSIYVDVKNADNKFKSTKKQYETAKVSQTEALHAMADISINPTTGMKIC
jgi:hypothetical protein